MGSVVQDVGTRPGNLNGISCGTALPEVISPCQRKLINRHKEDGHGREYRVYENNTAARSGFFQLFF